MVGERVGIDVGDEVNGLPVGACEGIEDVGLLEGWLVTNATPRRTVVPETHRSKKLPT